MRRKTLGAESLDASGGASAEAESDVVDPLEMLARVEDLDALRACLAAVAEEDGPLLGQLEAITCRRWKVAAAALGMAESTLRSRWGRLLDRLRVCMGEKAAKNLAPRCGGRD